MSAVTIRSYRLRLPFAWRCDSDLVEASKSPAAAAAAKEMCGFYRDHQQGDAAHDLAQYVSLALNLGGPPDFTPRHERSRHAAGRGLHPGIRLSIEGAITRRRSCTPSGKSISRNILALIDQYHGPVADMITSTDNYLRMPLSGYAGRSFIVYLEPMAAPGQVNSRNYMQDYYYLVISPAGSNIHMEALRHTYLHFVLDPLIAKRATALDRLKPILIAVQKAPMSEEYKLDTGLLVIECLIRAIEAQTPSDPQITGKGSPGDGAARRSRRFRAHGIFL